MEKALERIGDDDQARKEKHGRRCLDIGDSTVQNVATLGEEERSVRPSRITAVGARSEARAAAEHPQIVDYRLEEAS